MAGGLVPPATKWGVTEPIRKPLNAKTTADAVAQLSGAPHHKNGGILLQSKDELITLNLRWHPTRVSRWLIEFQGDQWCSTEGQATLIAFTRAIASAYPCIAGGLAPYDDWMAKHWETIVLPNGVESMYKRGYDFEGAITGLYWLTVLGPEAVAHIGRERLLALPIDGHEDLGAGGMLLRMRPDALQPALADRLSQDRALAQALDDDAIFDIERQDRTLRPIPLQ